MGFFKKVSKSVSKTVSKAVGHSKIATVAKKVVAVNVAGAAGVIGGFATGGPVGAVAGGIAGGTKGFIANTKTSKPVLNTKLLYQSGFLGAASGAVAGTVAGASGHAANAGIAGKFGGVMRSAWLAKTAPVLGPMTESQAAAAAAKTATGGFWGSLFGAAVPAVLNRGGGAQPETTGPETVQGKSGGWGPGGQNINVGASGPGLSGPDSNPNLTAGYGGAGGGVSDMIGSIGQQLSSNQNWIWIAVIGVIGLFLLRKKKFA